LFTLIHLKIPKFLLRIAKDAKGLPKKKIINRFGEQGKQGKQGEQGKQGKQGKQGEKKPDSRIGRRN
jgi:hypothetical protein